ncbi:hypothetical protein [Methylibium sp.]|uniref:hypothetical protein n=1 Tax=Methylibium sp. TaxID=2067992 RepID=UPI003D12F0FE
MAFIIPFIPAIASFLGATGFTLFAVTSASIIAGGILATQAAKKARDAARNAWNASLKDRIQMVRGAVEPRDLVLGRVRKSGALGYIATAGATKNELYMVIALAGHEIDAVEKVYFNDEEVTVDGFGNVTSAPYSVTRRKNASIARTVTVAGTVSGTAAFTPVAGTMRAFKINAGGGQFLHSGLAAPTASGLTITVTDAALQVGDNITITYSYDESVSYANVRWLLGSPTQAADAALMSALPTEWTSNHRLRGVAYLIVTLYYNSDIYTSGIPNVSVLMRGAKVFDPRTGVTAWSDNLALMFRHCAIHPLGGRLSAGQINDTLINAAANVCDISVAYSVLQPGGSTVVENRAQFRGGYVMRSGTRPKDALDELAEGMAGKWVFVGNVLRLKAGAYTSPVMSLGDDDFSDASPVQIQPTRPRGQLANVVTGTTIDDRSGYRTVDMPRVVATAYVTADGVELPMEIELAAVYYLPQAQHVAGIMLRDLRQALSIVARFKMRAYPIETLDTISLTNSRYGWSSKAFEVLGRRFTLDGAIELTLKETAAAVYTPSASFSAVDITPNTTLPSPFVVPTPTLLTVTSSTALADGSPQTRMKVTWSASANEAVLQSGNIEVAWIDIGQPDLSGDWSSVMLSGNLTEHVVTGLPQGHAHLVRIRAHTPLSKSAWSPVMSVIIAGVYTGSSDATNDLSLVAAAGVVISGNTVTKVAGTVWDASAYGRDSYTGGAYASAIAMQTNRALMFGLNTDPTTDSDYTSIDYAIYLRNDGLLSAYESGTFVGLGGPAYVVGDVLSLLYDGVTVRYLHNGLVRRTVTAPAGLRLYFDSSFSSMGGSIGGIRFGPMSAVTGIDTGQLVLGSVNDTLTLALGTTTMSSPAAPSYFGSGISFTAPATGVAIATIDFENQCNTGTAEATLTIDNGYYAACVLTNSAGTTVLASGSRASHRYARLARTLRGEFPITAGVSYMVRLQHNSPSGTFTNYYEARITVEIKKR